MIRMDEFEQIQDDHQLWVNFSSFGAGNEFAQLSDLFEKMLVPEVLEDASLEDEFNLMLASDYNWRIKIYFKLVEKKRQEDRMAVPWLEEKEVIKLHHWNILPRAPKIVCRPREIEKPLITEKSSTIGRSHITWTVNDVAKAGRLLTTPPIKTTFDDEQEMRRVYTLIYDTFRYKGILNQALDDISFYHLYPELRDACSCIWLLFFDLYHRSFKKRESSIIITAEKLFRACGLTDIEEALWKQRVKLAAAIARLRIKNNALHLNELLPRHLRDERLNNQHQICPVTCWINFSKVKNKEEVTVFLEKAMNLKPLEKNKSFESNSYQLDMLCPNFITFHHSLRTLITQSSLVQKQKLVVQDRSFCLGPATFGKIVLDLELTGSVIQSHVNSPRTTAYLATLLSQNSKISGLLAFSAGSRKEEYEDYFKQLGMSNIVIYSEKLIDLPPDANCLDRVIAVFATPPNSYSAVSDPIDLVCSRGGDLSMLEILTESELTEEGKERVSNILDEQRRTLRFVMSRPQIQLVLYETHSELAVENDDMVQKTMKEINKLAKLKHAALQGKLKNPSSQSNLVVQESKEINNNEAIKVNILKSEELIGSISSKRQSLTSKASAESIEMFDKIYKDVVVPNCDLFDKPQLPDLCSNQDYCLKPSDEGCYLALLQRKEVTKLDDKYLIQMAELRGLFGNTSESSTRVKGNRGFKIKKQEKETPPPASSKPKKKLKHIEFNRVAAPTQASIRHAHQINQIQGIQTCSKNRIDEEILSKVSQTRVWWSEATRHLTNLRQSLVNKKVLPSNKPASSINPKLFSNSLVHATAKIDEIVAKSSGNCKIPLFPRLRLSRNSRKIDKVPLPLTVTLVEFPQDQN